MNTEKIYTVRVAMVAGGCLSYVTCVQHMEILHRIGYGWRIAMAGLAGGCISMLVNTAAYYAEKRLSRTGAAPQPYWLYVKGKAIKRKPRHFVASGAAAMLAMLVGEVVYSPRINAAVQIFTGVLIGLAVGLVIEYLLADEADKVDGGTTIPVSDQAK